MENTIVKIYTDGATKGHNGKLGTVSKVGLGVHIPELSLGSYMLTDGISNNEAEFKALIWGMELAIQYKIRRAAFFLDSQIVVNRANGSKPAKAKYQNERMDAFQYQVLMLRTKFDIVTFTHIPREQNTVADYYSKLAINQSS